VVPVIEALLRTMEKIHRGSTITASFEGEGALQFRGERQDLEEMVGNLVDNACKWATSEIHLGLQRVAGQGASAAMLRIVVDDDGPGLSAEQRAQVAHRGQRLDESKPGSGLGLSIVVELATLYRGGLILGASPTGGLRAELTLPAA
jgi:signal transduction histidine kinase